MIKTTTSAALLVSLLISLNASAETLWEIYEKAQRSDPAINEAEANMMAQLEAKPQARSSLLPQITSSANWQNQSQ